MDKDKLQYTSLKAIYVRPASLTVAPTGDRLYPDEMLGPSSDQLRRFELLVSATKEGPRKLGVSAAPRVACAARITDLRSGYLRTLEGGDVWSASNLIGAAPVSPFP